MARFNRNKNPLSSIDRIEKIALNLEMDGSVAHEVKDLITLTGCTDLQYKFIVKNDIVKIDWDFTIEYYDTVRQIKTLTELLRHPCIRVASMTEKNNQGILFVELIDALREAETVIATRLQENNQIKKKGL